MSSAPPSANQQGAKITVYWLEKSRAQRILWLLEELNLEYELKLYKRGPDFLAGPDLKEVHPLGKSPLVGIQAEDAEKPIIIAESGTIIEYLLEHFGKDYIPKRYPEGKEGKIGAETEEWLRYRHLMHYAEGSLMTLLVLSLVINNIRNAPVPFFLKPITRGIASKVDSSFIDPNLTTHMTFLENYLAQSPNDGEFWCGSRLSGADFMMLFALEGATQRAKLEGKYPKLYAYVRRMQARDAYKRAAKKATEANGEEYVPYSDMKGM